MSLILNYNDLNQNILEFHSHISNLFCLDYTLHYFLTTYMEPAFADTHGYRVKAEFEDLMPPTVGRPDSYIYTPYCLPSYDPMFQLAMKDLDELAYATEDIEYYGAFNTTFQ